MIEIVLMKRGHRLWSKTINYAENCSWKAGRYLAELMKQNRFIKWERVLIALDTCENIVGFCAFMEKDELPDRYDFSTFIGFMFVDEKHRGNRISQMLIARASQYAEELGYKNIYIMSGEVGLYEKYGFNKIGEYETIYNTIDQLFVKKICK